MAREITCDVIHEFVTIGGHEDEKHVLRLVSWNKGDPKLEFRRLYKDDEGNWKNGKAAGIPLPIIEDMIRDKVLESCLSLGLGDRVPHEDKIENSPDAPDFLKD